MKLSRWVCRKLIFDLLVNKPLRKNQKRKTTTKKKENKRNQKKKENKKRNQKKKRKQKKRRKKERKTKENRQKQKKHLDQAQLHIHHATKQTNNNKKTSKKKHSIVLLLVDDVELDTSDQLLEFCLSLVMTVLTDLGLASSSARNVAKRAEWETNRAQCLAIVISSAEPRHQVKNNKPPKPSEERPSNAKPGDVARDKLNGDMVSKPR